MDDCIFCKIASHDVPKEFTYEDEDVMVFPDIHPQKPTHLLIIPKKHLTDFMSMDEAALWDKIRLVAQNMIREFGLVEAGFKITNNGGGSQLIDHLHFHLLGPMAKEA